MKRTVRYGDIYHVNYGPVGVDFGFWEGIQDFKRLRFGHLVVKFRPLEVDFGFWESILGLCDCF